MKKILSQIFVCLLLSSAVFATPEPGFTLDISSDELQDVLHTYAMLSGLELVESSEVKAIHTLVTIQPIHQVTKAEALKLIEEAVKDQAGVVIKRLDDKKVSVTKVKK